MTRLSLHRVSYRNLLWQVLAVALVFVVVVWLVWNAIGNSQSRGVGFGLDFLLRSANIPIGETLIDYTPGDANYRAILVGLFNSIFVALLGIGFATALGTAVGVARLSGNYVAEKLAGGYVEYVRNVPLLAHLFIVYLLLQGLPPLRAAVSVGEVVFLSNRGLVVPSFGLNEGSVPMVLAFSMLVATAIVTRIATVRWTRTLQIAARLMWAAAACLAAYGVFFFTIELPVLEGRRFIGGQVISPEFTALVLGLTLYYASFIAEIVRGGILSVPKGQWEAATALGFSRARTLRLIVMPQALRLMIPPMTSQYLDLAKMTSLAIAIGYPDLVAVVNSIITDTGRAIECVAIIMTAFLLVNLTISAFMNWLNLRVAPMGRVP